MLVWFLVCLKIVYLFFPEGILHNSQMKVENRVGFFNPLSTNPIKWSNTLKKFVANLPTNRLSAFDHFANFDNTNF